MPIIEAVSQAPAGDYPPYPVWAGSEYQGWLWTMDNDRFNRADVRHSCLSRCDCKLWNGSFLCNRSLNATSRQGRAPGRARHAFSRCSLQRNACPLQTLANWPPSVPGACKWWAHLQGTLLVIARDKPLPEEGSHGGKSMSGSQAHAHDSEDALVVREIDLQGCRHAGFSSRSLAPRLHAQLCSLLQAGYDIRKFLLRSWLRHEGAHPRVVYGLLVRLVVPCALG